MCEEKGEQGQSSECQALGAPGETSGQRKGEADRHATVASGGVISFHLWVEEISFYTDSLNPDEQKLRNGVVSPSSAWQRWTPVQWERRRDGRRTSPVSGPLGRREVKNFIRVQHCQFCRTISGLTKVLVRFAMTLHTWSRILMEYISSSRRT